MRATLFVASLLVGASLSDLTSQEKQTLLDYHNTIRQNTASGNVVCSGGNCPTGTIGRVSWDPAIAKVAQAWADNMANTCTMSHNSNRNSQTCAYSSDITFVNSCSSGTNPSLGENVAYAAGSSERTALDTIDGWYESEHSIYVYGTNYQSAAGHYSQMVWHNTRYIGCGCSKNNCNGMVAKYCACNYYPPGNYGGQAPYSNNGICGSCSSDMSSCVNSLCQGCMSTTSNNALCQDGLGNSITTSPTAAAAPTDPPIPTPQPSPQPTNTPQPTSAVSSITVQGFSYSGFNGAYPVESSSYGTDKKPTYGPNPNGFYFYYNSYYDAWMLVGSTEDFSDTPSYSGVYSICYKDPTLGISDCSGSNWNNYNGGIIITNDNDSGSTDDDSSDDDDGSNTLPSISVTGFSFSGFNGAFPVFQASYGTKGLPIYGPNSQGYYFHYNAYYGSWFLTKGGSSITDGSSYSGLYSYCTIASNLGITSCSGKFSKYDGGKSVFTYVAAYSASSSSSNSASDIGIGILIGVGSMTALVGLIYLIYWLVKRQKEKSRFTKVVQMETANNSEITEYHIMKN